MGSFSFLQIASLLLALVLLFLSAALLGICVSYITDADIARDVVVLYTVALCATLWLSRQNVIGVGCLLIYGWSGRCLSGKCAHPATQFAYRDWLAQARPENWHESSGGVSRPR